jgi:hypothetical protein
MPGPTLHAGPVDLDALDAFLLSDRAPEDRRGRQGADRRSGGDRRACPVLLDVRRPDRGGTLALDRRVNPITGTAGCAAQ